MRCAGLYLLPECVLGKTIQIYMTPSLAICRHACHINLYQFVRVHSPWHLGTHTDGTEHAHEVA